MQANEFKIQFWQWNTAKISDRVAKEDESELLTGSSFFYRVFIWHP